MNFIELLFVAVGVSMDAFAAAICKGLTFKRATRREASTVGLYFGIFQAAMPLLGYLLGMRFADRISAWDHWIAFGLLAFIGGKLILESFQDDVDAEDCAIDEGDPLSPKFMFPLAVATSIDALALGVTFAFLKVNILPTVTIIGMTTFAFSALGVVIGQQVGAKFQSRAELAGGVILVLIGLKILLEHTGIL